MTKQKTKQIKKSIPMTIVLSPEYTKQLKSIAKFTKRTKAALARIFVEEGVDRDYR